MEDRNLKQGIDAVEQIFAASFAAVKEKGGTVANPTTAAGLPDAIRAIPAGGSMSEDDWYKQMRRMFEADVAPGGLQKKTLVLLPDSSPLTVNLAQMGLGMTSAVKTSDGYEGSPVSRQWDTSKDIDTPMGYRVRWVISYGTALQGAQTMSILNQTYLNNFTPIAIYLDNFIFTGGTALALGNTASKGTEGLRRLYATERVFRSAGSISLSNLKLAWWTVIPLSGGNTAGITFSGMRVETMEYPESATVFNGPAAFAGVRRLKIPNSLASVASTFPSSASSYIDGIEVPDVWRPAVASIRLKSTSSTAEPLLSRKLLFDLIGKFKGESITLNIGSSSLALFSSEERAQLAEAGIALAT